MGITAMIAAIGFDPHIRGILVVIVGTVVLAGGVYMLLATNLGARVGILVSSAAIFGWCFMMGIVWVIYGIGLVGRAAAWMPTDVNYSRETPIPVEEVSELPAFEDLDDAEEMLEEYPLLWALAVGAEGPEWEAETLTELKTIVEPWIQASTRTVVGLRGAALTEGTDILAGEPEAVALLNEGGDALRDEVRAQSEEVRDRIQEPLGGWCLLTESDPRRGEAEAPGTAALVEENAFGEGTSSASFIVKDIFVFGGKERCKPAGEESVVEKTIERVRSTFELKHPETLGAMTVGKAKEFVVPDGEAPPPAELEEGTSTVTVVMLRNLGNLRLIPFWFTLVNLAGFVICVLVLHYRDKRAMEVRAAFEGKTA